MRDVLVLAAPFLFVALYLIAAAVNDFAGTLAYDDWWSEQYRLRTLYGQRVRRLARLLPGLSLRARLDPAAEDPALLRLRVGRADWARWESAPLALWGTWVDAVRIEGGRGQRVKIRKRGDTSVHWITEKKSFTLKARRRSLDRGYRRLVYSAKAVIPQALAGHLAQSFGLLAPHTTIAPVFVNDRFYGLFRVIEPVDESFLRRHRRLPGWIYRGDAAERGEVYHGVPRGLFSNPYIWELVARNDRPGAPAPDAIRRLDERIHAATPGAHRELLEQVDADALVRVIAYLFVVGDPYHMSNVHNQFWYEDPASGRLVLIPWDVRLLDLNARPPHPLNEVFRALLRDPVFLQRVVAVWARDLADDHLASEAEGWLRARVERHRDALAFERLREPGIPPLGDADGALALLRANIERLRSWVRDARVRLAAAAAPGGRVVIDLASHGHAAAQLEALSLRLNRPLATPPRLRADRNRNGRPDPADPIVPTRWRAEGARGRLALLQPLALLPGMDERAWRLRPAAIPYRLFLELGPGAKPRAVEPELRNPYTGDRVEPEAWPAGEAIPEPYSWHPWRFERPRLRELVWRGVVRVERTLDLGPEVRLRIEPGTRVRLAPDVSLVVRGRVEALGTRERPILFEPLTPGRPWGAFALQGKGASGSVLREVRFRGGGGATVGRVEYTGMVNVHEARDVRFERCRFERNLRSDDALHAAEARVVVSESRFVATNADAIDFDDAEGAILDSRFEQVGNDAIDLMASAPAILGNRIVGADDKGISVGERSSPLVLGNRIQGCARAIEIKDDSEPWLVANELVGNRVAVLERHKNLHYPHGGWGKWVSGSLEANGQDLRVEDDSRWSAWGEQAPEPVAARATNDRTARSLLAAALLRRYGVERAARGWRVAAPVAEVAALVLDEGLDRGVTPWRVVAGEARLERRGRTLVARLRRQRVELARPLEWKLRPRKGGYLLVVEVGGGGFDRARLELRGEREAPGLAFAPAREPGQVHLLAAPIPAGRYRELRIGVEGAAPRAARVSLRALRVFELPVPRPARRERPERSGSRAPRVAERGQRG